MDREPTIDDLRAVWPILAKDVLASTLQCLSAAREAGGGDVDLFLIMLLVALRTAQTEGFQKLTIEEIAAGQVGALPSLTTNVRSIADSLRMPRETARRKVALLIEMGWIETDGRLLRVSQRHGTRATEMREALMGSVFKQHVAIRRALATAANTAPALRGIPKAAALDAEAA